MPAPKPYVFPPLEPRWVHSYRPAKTLTETAGLNARHAKVAKARREAREERERLRAQRGW